MFNRKIVIISAHFFPRISPRANRTSELAKELARLGHDVTVYAVLGKYDYSHFEEIHNLKVRGLGKMIFVPFNSDGDTKKSFLRSVATKLLRKIIEYPNIELSFKVAKVLKNERDIDLLITIGAPHPIHWGAAYGKKYFNKNNIKKWIADCGDPYMGNMFDKPLFYFKPIEKWFCKKADYLTIPLKQAKGGYYKEFHDKVKIIPQGFNFEDVKIEEKANINSVVTFIYAGNFYTGIRDPRQFLDYLCEQNIDFKFILYTKSLHLVESYKDKLKDKLVIKDYISRPELLEVMSQADFLINFENGTEIQSPSKLIDYALTKRPILSVNSFQLNKKVINQFLNKNYTGQYIVQNIQQYNIKNVANEFISLSKK